jgi:hypothetical protein
MMTHYTTTARIIEQATARTLVAEAAVRLREAVKHFERAGDTKQAAAVRAAIGRLEW